MMQIKNMSRYFFIYCLIIFFANSVCRAGTGRIHTRQFSIRLPESMIRIPDTCDAAQGDLYADTVSWVLLIISERNTRFRSVNDYIDCSEREIEDRLRIDYGDSTLSLYGCTRSVRYPEKINILHFRVSVLPMGYDTYMMYFVHHRGKDIQFTFIYKSWQQGTSIEYFNSIMSTLKLK